MNALSACRAGLALIAALACATTAPAQVPAAAPDTLSLTDAQKADISAQATEDSVDAARAGLDGTGAPDRKIHGEMGVMIGSHGTRGAYGTAAIPLGDHAGAVISVENSRYGARR